MTFIITFVALIVERFFHWTHIRQWRWFSHYERFLQAKLGQVSSPVLLAASLLPPVLLVGLINWVICGWVYGLIKLLFGLSVLLYCLGPNNLWLQVYRSLSELNKENPSAAMQEAQVNFALPSADSQTFHANFVRAIFIAAEERIFSVIFWFAVLGPMGAVLYRLITVMMERSNNALTPMLGQAKSILDWLPVRLFTFLFALAGNFKNVFKPWRLHVLKGYQENSVLLAECGLAALDLPNNAAILDDGSTEKETLALLDRAFIISLVLLALLSLVI